MFFGAIFILAVASIPLFGGRLSALAELRLRGVPAIGLALAVQVLIISVVPHGSPALHNAVHLSTYLLVAVFAWLNRRVPGLAVAGLGGMANFAAIAANGGVMPASEGALRFAGLAGPAAEFRNSTAVDHARLQVLGDIFAAPASWPLHNVFSIGDILLLGGIAVGMHIVCASRPMLKLGLHPVSVRGAETVETGTSKTLVRIATRPWRGMSPGQLILVGSGGSLRLNPLPGSDAVAGYAVPTSFIRRPGGRIGLHLPNGTTLDITERLSSPAPEAVRRPQVGFSCVD